MITNNDFQKESVTSRNGDYIEATRKGFEFGKVAKLYNKLSEKLQQAHKRMEGKEASSFRIFISFIGIFVAIVLGFVEASNISMTLVAIGNFGPKMAMVIAMGFVCMGLIIGEELNAGLVKDEFTGKRKPTGRFWGAVIIGLIYVGIQIFLALQASAGGSTDMSSDVTYTVIFSILICLAEIAFGFIFLRTAVTSLSLYALKIRLRLLLRKLNGIAKMVETLWTRYAFIMQRANVETAEETDAVKAARQFYSQGGFSEENDSITE